MEDALLNALEEDARTQCAAIIEEAGKAAADIIAEAEKEVSILREERFDSLNIRLRELKTSSINAARVRAEGLKLKARHEIIEKVLDDALEGFKGLPREEYAEVLKSLYEELKKEWGSREKPVVLVNPEDTGFIKEASFEVRPDPDVRLGAVFVSGDGRIRYENTIPSRIKSIRPDLVAAVEKTLFGVNSL